MIKNKIKNLKNRFKEFNIDGYIVPKNNEFFSEYDQNHRLKNISNFFARSCRKEKIEARIDERGA